MNQGLGFEKLEQFANPKLQIGAFWLPLMVRCQQCVGGGRLGTTGGRVAAVVVADGFWVANQSRGRCRFRVSGFEWWFFWGGGVKGTKKAIGKHKGQRKRSYECLLVVECLFIIFFSKEQYLLKV